MSSPYDARLAEIKRQITAQKNIYKFRTFLYSLNKNVRQTCFRISLDFFENEYNNPMITATERERLQNLRNHWQLSSFENTATDWWSTLLFNHSTSLSLMTLIHLWIDDITVFDSEAFETSTLGIR
jgi:hypothetical protein